MTNNKLTDGRSRLREAAKNYQTALAWYQSNIDSPAALQTWDAATSEFMAAIGNRETDIIADLLDEIDELQERRKAEAVVPDDYFASLVAAARVRADKAMRKFPQPNYVLNKVAEESGEVIKAVIHYTEGREEWTNVEGEIIDNLAMLIRLIAEGDQVIGFTPPDTCRTVPQPAPVVPDSEPVADVVAWHKEGEERTCDIRWRRFDVEPGPLYAVPQSALLIPETLPCAVELKPGLIINKGCKTETLLTALQRRTDYYAEINSMTPEERAEHDANIAAFKAMLPQQAQVDNE